jgi:hypothetical protein
MAVVAIYAKKMNPYNRPEGQLLEIIDSNISTAVIISVAYYK